METRVNVTRARQGRPGKPVVWVLVISTVLGAAALFGAWFMHADDLAAVNTVATGKTAAQNFSTPEPTPRQNTDSPPPATSPAATAPAT